LDIQRTGAGGGEDERYAGVEKVFVVKVKG
jgi:hypothetical protein